MSVETIEGKYLMESINKFKMLTIMIICAGVFAIAAMYVNTKDVTEQKNQENSEEQYDYTDPANDATTKDLTYSLNQLENKVKKLEARINDNSRSPKSSASSSSNGMRCKIIGTKTVRGIEELSPDVALQDARINGNDIVVTCSLK